MTEGTMWSVLLEILLIVTSSSYALQEFDTMPSDAEVNPAESATLTCRVLNRKGECVWLKNGRVVGLIANKYAFERQPSNGDCSIHIEGSKLEEDDGLWECQVTQTSAADSTLTSPEVKFTVREAPLPPRIEDNTIQIQPGESFRTRSGDARRLHCVSRKGNPPAVMKWFIEEEELVANQTNSTDVDKAKTWQAVSILDYTFKKEHNGKSLRCVSIHPAYDTNSRDIVVNMEVLYPPIIRLEGNPKEDIEESKMLSLKCVADANPQANIIWRKSGQSGIYDIKDQLDFFPIRRTDSGVYSCSAKNDVGQSQELEVAVDVKFKPKIIRIIPSPVTTVILYDTIKLSCEAEGNPKPRYTWLQKVEGTAGHWVPRSQNSSLYIHNVTYRYQGKYICEVTNLINGVEFKATSEEITLDVTGAPQVLADKSKTGDRVQVEKDEDASIVIYFCSDPRPQKIYWEWGSFKLDTGSDHVRYIAEPLLPDQSHTDCYEARLIVQRVEGKDSRKYTLIVENERGRETYAVALEVREPVAIPILIAAVIGCIILLLIFTLIILYLLRTERWCFKRKKGFKTDLESETESGRLASDHNGRAIPPDALYATPKNTMVVPHDNVRHYENIKHDQNENRNKDSLVYANLNLPRSDQNGVPRRTHRQSQERIEYAEIKFQPASSELVHM